MKNQILGIIIFFSVLSASAQSQRIEELCQRPTRPKVGLVLSGGGAKGIAEVGVLKAIDELGIPIDYIGGTSMGAIVGGFYALGYTGAQLDSLMRTLKWGTILSDKGKRKNIYILEKMGDDKYFFQLNFENNKKPLLPKGAIAGQHIENLFYTLTSPSYKINSFDSLPIPYYCVATDIISGHALKLTSGNLTSAMRSSMAVPTVFTPVYKDSFLLVDGGITNNFPVDLMKEMGADIIIGVDVSFEYSEIKDLDDIFSILRQTIFITSKELYVKNQKLCDIYVMPKNTTYSSFDFKYADSLLAIGDRAAQDIYPQLQELADNLKKYGENKKKQSFVLPTSYTIDTLNFIGLNKYSPHFCNLFLQLKSNTTISLVEINNAIERLYGSLVFDKVTYSFSQSPKDPDHVILNVAVEEAYKNSFGVGLRFDNHNSVALLANTVLRNMLTNSSRLSLDLEISKSPYFKIAYNYSPSWKNSRTSYSLWAPAIGLSYSFYNLSSYTYRDNRKFSQFTSFGHLFNINAQFSFKNDILSVGFAYDYNDIGEVLGNNSQLEAVKNYLLYPYLFYYHDSYNETFFPTKGSKLNFKALFVNQVEESNNVLEKFAKNYLNIYFSGEKAIKIKRRLTFLPGFYVGANLLHNEDKINNKMLFFMGGDSPISYIYNINFVGLNFMQQSGKYIWATKANLQFHTSENLYLTLKINIGDVMDKLPSFKKPNLKSIAVGTGLSISYKTPIGPASLTFHGSNYTPFGIYFSVGYFI